MGILDAYNYASLVGKGLNPLTPKFTSWKQPFPGIEHVAHFLMSPLTLCSLHEGQTSQGKCAVVAFALEPVNDIHDSPGAWQVVTDVECVFNFLTILPQIGEEKNSFACGTMQHANWVSFVGAS